MITVTKVMTTETAHRLIDYVGKCAHIHGHSYKWEVTVARELGGTASNGIAVDFGVLKEMMKKVIYDVFDHALVLSEQDPLLKGADAFDGDVSSIRYAGDGSRQKVMSFPGNPTAENFAVFVAQELEQHFTDSENIDIQRDIQILKVRVWETANSFGEWIR